MTAAIHVPRHYALTSDRRHARSTHRRPDSGARRSLREGVGITDVFGIPGGAIMPFYDALMDSTSSCATSSCRHEQGAGHAAEGYAAASRQGRRLHRAPAAPAPPTWSRAIADANMDSVPLLAITGQVFATSMGTDAFQEVDIVGITMPITKHTLPRDPPRGRARDARRRVPHRHDRPPRPGARRRHEGRAAEDGARSSGRRRSTCPATARSTKAHGKQIARPRRSCSLEAKRPCSTSAAASSAPRRSQELLDARRADRRARRHDADGARRLPGLAPAAPRHARHARHRARRARAAGGRPDRRRSAPASTTG